MTESSGSVEEESDRLDRTFFALSDPTRRALLERLEEEPLLVSELAEPFEMSVQAISRHIKVLVRAGLVTQERSGRISRCRIDVGPMYGAAVWINRYSKYWQTQFDTLAGWLDLMTTPSTDAVGEDNASTQSNTGSTSGSQSKKQTRSRKKRKKK